MTDGYFDGYSDGYSAGFETGGSRRQGEGALCTEPGVVAALTERDRVPYV